MRLRLDLVEQALGLDPLLYATETLGQSLSILADPTRRSGPGGRGKPFAAAIPGCLPSCYSSCSVRSTMALRPGPPPHATPSTRADDEGFDAPPTARCPLRE
jgi:hypothetical protein